MPPEAAPVLDASPDVEQESRLELQIESLTSAIQGLETENSALKQNQARLVAEHQARVSALREDVQSLKQ